MKKLISYLIICILIVVAVFTYQNYKLNSNKNSQVKTDNESTNATAAPNFTLNDTNGNEVSLKDLEGKKVFLNFWATWCSPCMSEMPHIEKLYNETKDTDLIILAINIGDEKSEVENYIKDANIHFKILLDSDKNASFKYNISGVPTSYLIDENGNITNQYIGALNYEQLKAFVEKK